MRQFDLLPLICFHWHKQEQKIHFLILLDFVRLVSYSYNSCINQTEKLPSLQLHLRKSVYDFLAFFSLNRIVYETPCFFVPYILRLSDVKFGSSPYPLQANQAFSIKFPEQPCHTIHLHFLLQALILMYVQSIFQKHQ